MEINNASNLFQFYDGACPYCRGAVGIVESLIFAYDLNKKGESCKMNSETYKVAGFCHNCCRALFVLPNANGTHTVYPSGTALPYIMGYGSVEGRIKDMNDDMKKIAEEYVEQNNPFVVPCVDDGIPF